MQCTGQKQSDDVLVFWQYILPWIVEEGQEACDVELRNTRRELLILLRMDLLDLLHISSRFAPCVFLEKVAHDFEFTRVRIILASTH